jgi:hypothetical protein
MCSRDFAPRVSRRAGLQYTLVADANEQHHKLFFYKAEPIRGENQYPIQLAPEAKDLGTGPISCR